MITQLRCTLHGAEILDGLETSAACCLRCAANQHDSRQCQDNFSAARVAHDSHLQCLESCTGNENVSFYRIGLARQLSQHDVAMAVTAEKYLTPERLFLLPDYAMLNEIIMVY